MEPQKVFVAFIKDAIGCHAVFTEWASAQWYRSEWVRKWRVRGQDANEEDMTIMEVLLDPEEVPTGDELPNVFRGRRKLPRTVILGGGDGIL